MDFKIKIPKTAVPWLVGAGVVTGGAVIGLVSLMKRSYPYFGFFDYLLTCIQGR